LQKGKNRSGTLRFNLLGSRTDVASQKVGGSLCPSRALAGGNIRGEKYDFLQMRQSAWVRGWKGY